MYDLCNLDLEDEYSLHHEFSQRITDADEDCIKKIIDYILPRGHPFNIIKRGVQNIVTGIQLQEKTSKFLISCIAIGESAYQHFRTYRLDQKTIKLFETIPKSQLSSQSSLSKKAPKIDVKQETIKFMRHIDYARLRNYNVHKLLQYEITCTSLFLTKDKFLRKPAKSACKRNFERC